MLAAGRIKFMDMLLKSEDGGHVDLGFVKSLKVPVLYCMHLQV